MTGGGPATTGRSVYLQTISIHSIHSIHLAPPCLRLSPKNYKKFFFVRSKKFLCPVLSGGKDSTPAKFQLDRFIAVGGVDGQTHKHTHTPGPYVNYSRISK